MKWFSNLKTMTKLVTGFLITGAIILVMSGLGADGLSKLRENLRVVYADYTVAATDLARCSNNLTRYRNNAVQMSAAKNREEFEGISREQEPLARGMSEAIDAYAATVLRVSRSGRDEAKDLAAFQKTLKEYFDAGRITLQWSEKAWATSDETERNSFREKARINAVEVAGPRLAEATAALDQLLGTVTEVAKDMNDDGAKTADTGMKILIVGTTIAIVLCLSLGFYLARTISRSENAMRDTLSEVSLIAEGLASASQQLSAASQEISTGAQEQASNLEETASSLEEITSTVKQNADNAQQANQLASRSREVAEKGGQVVQSAVNGMHEINKASKQIADIITVIDEIAFQTNLLALNAAVEAARAGEQGRGFAVVAGEVRNLAQRSAGAAKEIKGLIQDSVRKVEAGSQLVNQSGETLQEIVTSVKRVTDIVGEIAAASREQSTGIDQVSKAVAQMDQVTQTNASQTEELSGTAESLAGQAHQLQDLLVRNNVGKTAVEVKKQTARPVADRTLSLNRAGRKTLSETRRGGSSYSATDSSPLEKRVEGDLDLIAAGVTDRDDGFAEF